MGNGKNPAEVTKVFRSFFSSNKEKIKSDISILFHNRQLLEVAADITQGIFLGEYQIAKLKTGVKEKISFFTSDFELNFQGEGLENLNRILERGRSLAQTQMKIMSWVDAPANYKTPQMVAGWIQESGKENGFEVEVYNEKACEEMGLKALLAVGRGSMDNPAEFVVMKYTHPEAQKTVGLIGKGVTFDTGGVSLHLCLFALCSRNNCLLFKKDKRMPIISAPEGRFENLPDYPFAPHFVEVGAGLKMHYVDEGAGRDQGAGFVRGARLSFSPRGGGGIGGDGRHGSRGGRRGRRPHDPRTGRRAGGAHLPSRRGRTRGGLRLPPRRRVLHRIHRLAPFARVAAQRRVRSRRAARRLSPRSRAPRRSPRGSARV